ncbi:PH domain-containing protein [Micromonospora sp. HM5-17]|uniref:PH domain-containing protein n=1 Tax=Micromonospora sp. HM5-17 TaxID=2487710 RepID=UPI000F48B98E|nr:PH domain-containing protein [Micromonospora sp. HM5-17]ROT34283.1 PH domain-containing protein [Micromonospora sp. HM5-17]
MDDPAAHWRVRPALPVLKLTGAALLVALALLLGDGDAVRIGVAILAALGLLAWGVRDVVAPVRLAAGPTGVTVISGYAGRRHLPWEAIERIGVDTRPRLGLRTETLELDTGESLHLFGQSDLGDAPTEVAAVLRRMRTTYASGGFAR